MACMLENLILCVLFLTSFSLEYTVLYEIDYSCLILTKHITFLYSSDKCKSKVLCTTLWKDTQIKNETNLKWYHRYFFVYKKCTKWLKWSFIKNPLNLWLYRLPLKYSVYNLCTSGWVIWHLGKYFMYYDTIISKNVLC